MEYRYLVTLRSILLAVNSALLLNLCTLQLLYVIYTFIFQAIEASSDDVDDLEAEIDEQFAELDLAEDMKASWSDADRLVIGACIGLIKTTNTAVKKVSKAIEMNGQSSSVENNAQLDSFVEHVCVISPVVDDLASALYPPVRLPIVRTHVR